MQTRLLAVLLEETRREGNKTKSQLLESRGELRDLRTRYENLVDQAGQVAEEVSMLNHSLMKAPRAYDASIAEVTRLENLVMDQHK